jgi:ABC-2 type transport system ATP-binding protein
MTAEPYAIEVRELTRGYGRADAVVGLGLRVRRGACYGFFGPNGAGKTTTIKCLLNLLRPDAGSVRLFGLDPARDEVAVKGRLAYVPDAPAFYPWMTVRDTLDYLASFRRQWDRRAEADLLARFRLDPGKRTAALSKGQTAQLALTAAICPSPDLLVLDEPTSGLDPVMRREFLETVIGAYQDADPENRTVFFSTHQIAEVEGLIDEFTIIDGGRAVLTATADTARQQFRRIRARFRGEPPAVASPGALAVRHDGRELEVLVGADGEDVVGRLRTFGPEALEVEGLGLEDIYVTALGAARGVP